MSLSLGIGLGVAMQRGVSGGFSPSALFASGEEGVWYDYSDLSTLWQDAAGTIPVTADNDHVRRVDDKSGNGNNAITSSDDKRPLYKTSGGLSWLEFDGSDDAMATGNIDLSAGDKMSAFIAAHKNSDAVAGNLFEFSNTIGANNGSFRMTAPESGSLTYAWRSKGTIIALKTLTTFTAPITNVLTGLGDISGDSAIIRIDGNQVGESTADQGTGNYGNLPLHIGSRAGSSFFFAGKMYGLIIRGAQSSADEISDTETYLAGKSGVTL